MFFKRAALKLIDFGVAIRVSDDMVFNSRVGTNYFMSQEVCGDLLLLLFLNAIFSQSDWAQVNDPQQLALTGTVLKTADGALHLACQPTPRLVSSNSTWGDFACAAAVWSLGIILYMLLTGTEPLDEIKGQVQYEEIEWPDEPAVSDAAKDLVGRMLELDHTKRITAAEALQHPWIANNESNAVASLGVVVAALREFSVSKMMRKVVANLMNKKSSEEEHQHLFKVTSPVVCLAHVSYPYPVSCLSLVLERCRCFKSSMLMGIDSSI